MCVCVPRSALPSCLRPDLICRLQENHVFVLTAESVTTVLVLFSLPLFITLRGKKEKEAEKDAEKGKQEGRE